GVEGRQVEAGLPGGEEELEYRDLVAEDGSDRVAAPQPEGAQAVHDLVGGAQERAGGHLPTEGIDDGEVPRGFLGELPEADIGHGRLRVGWSLRQNRTCFNTASGSGPCLHLPRGVAMTGAMREPTENGADSAAHPGDTGAVELLREVGRAP